MTPELFGMLKALAGGSTLALVLMIVIYYLWKDSKAQQRCASPDKDPCGVCQLCVSRRHSVDLSGLQASMKLLGERFSKAIEFQESKHAEEITAERVRGDLLQDENKKTLRELMDFFKGTDHD